MNAPGLSVVAIGSPIRVVCFHESSVSSRLVLLHLLLCVALGLLMGTDVTRDAQRFKVRWVVCQPLHLLLSLGRLHRFLVMHINR